MPGDFGTMDQTAECIGLSSLLTSYSAPIELDSWRLVGDLRARD